MIIPFAGYFRKLVDEKGLNVVGDPSNMVYMGCRIKYPFFVFLTAINDPFPLICAMRVI